MILPYEPNEEYDNMTSEKFAQLDPIEKFQFQLYLLGREHYHLTTGTLAEDMEIVNVLANLERIVTEYQVKLVAEDGTEYRFRKYSECGKFIGVDWREVNSARRKVLKGYTIVPIREIEVRDGHGNLVEHIIEPHKRLKARQE